MLTSSTRGQWEQHDKNKTFREGIELAVHFSSMDIWIPVMYLSMGNTRNKTISIEMCNFRLNDAFMIRWLQSSCVIQNHGDIWGLDEISVYLKTGETDCNILQDKFDNTTHR